MSRNRLELSDEIRRVTIDPHIEMANSLQETAKKALFYVKLIPYVFNTLKGLVMKDWKTTLTAVLGAVAYCIDYFTGFAVPPDVIVLVTSIVGFYFAGDSKKDG